VFYKKDEKGTAFNPSLDLNDKEKFAKYGYISYINKTKK